VANFRDGTLVEALADGALSWALAALCYAGAVLYGGVLSVSGRHSDAAAWQLAGIYIGFFPTPPGSSLWLLQAVFLCGVMISAGPDIAINFLRAVRERASPGERRLSAGTFLAVVLPAAAILAWVSWRAAYLVVPAGSDPVRLNAAVGPIYGVLTLAIGAYFTFAWLLGRALVRDTGHVPLLAVSKRFHQMNGFAAVGAPVLAAIFFAYGPLSLAGQAAILVVLVVQLAPGLNELSLSYDAVLTRISTVHVVLVVAAAIVVLVPDGIEALGGDRAMARGAVLVLLAVAAIALPERIETATLAWLFPRAAESRARLERLIGEPFAASDRREASRVLLERVVEALDAEGGIVVLGSEGGEPALIESTGRSDTTALGEAGGVARWIASLAPDGVPRWFEKMPAADRALLLRAGAVLVCPLGAGSFGALLLGPRRGWLYDSRTLRSLERLGRQARLAFENQDLARSHAHAEKLAALGEAAARIAHEIRNPLTAARSLVQLAGGEAAVRDVAEPALEELDRIGRLVGDLLAFARREDALAREDLDLTSVCRDALAQVAPLAEAAQVAIGIALESVHVVGDRDRLLQVVANLVRNGIEALTEKSGSRRLEIRCGATDGRAFVEVADDGPGIPPPSVSRRSSSRSTRASGRGRVSASRSRAGSHLRTAARSPCRACSDAARRSALRFRSRGDGHGIWHLFVLAVPRPWPWPLPYCVRRNLRSLADIVRIGLISRDEAMPR